MKERAKTRKELTVKDLENLFSPFDPLGQKLVKEVRNGVAKAFQDEKGEVYFEYP